MRAVWPAIARAGCVCMALLCFSTPTPAADAPLMEDRIRFIIHDDIAGQLTAATLAGYLDQIHDKLHASQSAGIDVPSCTDFGTVTDGGSPPVLFTSSGGLASSLAVIENEQELTDVLAWGATQGSRVGIFVQDIQWCGAPVNAIGCAPAPGNVFVVAIDAPHSLRAVVIAHERTHNAGQLHRTDDACALMQPFVGTANGCLNATEATAIYNQADINTGDTCECIDLVTMGPFATWSLNPAGTVCDDNSACTIGESCAVGLCVGGTAPDCSDGDICTDDICDSVTGCSNPPALDGTSCEDGDLCNGFDSCVTGICQHFAPLICDDALFCNGAEGCSPASGCFAGTAPPTDDGVSCTDDSCDETNDVVVNTPNDLLCTNGAFCDGDETCTEISGCVAGTPPPLDDGIPCTDDSCDEGADLVVHLPDPASCDDLDPCTADSCDELTGCGNVQIPLCGVAVPATPGWGRLLLGALIVLSGAIVVPRRLHFRR